MPDSIEFKICYDYFTQKHPRQIIIYNQYNFIISGNSVYCILPRFSNKIISVNDIPLYMIFHLVLFP